MQAILQFISTGTHPLSGPGDPFDNTGKYLIKIVDDNGNPINGDNIVVYYYQIYNDVPQAVQSIAVPGLSIEIYNGITYHYDGFGSGENNYSIQYLLSTEDQPEPGVPGVPITPDLAIQSVSILQKADSNGADGIIRINATSSFGPINYFIDDNPVLYPRFAGITSGNHVAKCTDASGAEVVFPFFVPQVNSILQKDPSVVIGGKISRWNAAFNPIVFEYAREDYTVLGIAQDDTTLKPKVNIDADLTDLEIGDYIYLDYSPYKGAYKVLAKISTDTAVIDTDYLAPVAVTGFVNIDALRPYYKVITKITFVNVDTGLFDTIVSTNRPINGITRADISSFLQSILKPQPDLSNYTAINYRDMGLAASYQISYAETWDGNTPIYSDITTPFYVVWSAKQLQELGGGNLYQSVTQPGGVSLAKWLTDFTEPSYTPGYPFDLPFIYSEQVAGRQLYYKIIALDINRQPIAGGPYTSFLLNENGSYLLNQDGSKFIIARQSLVNTPIVEHVGLNRLLINQDFGPTVCYLSVQLFYDEDTTPVPVTEVIIVKVDLACDINPVYLRYIGLNGSWNYFRFNYNQTKTLDVQNANIIKEYVFDWANAEGIEKVISKDGSDKMQLFADALSKSDIDGLQALKFGVIAQVLSQKTPIKWKTIVVNSSTFTEYDTQNEQYEFSITYNLPSKNIQSQ